MNGHPDHASGRVQLRPNEVEVRMLAIRERLPGVRAVVVDMAMRADFDLDTIADLRLAVEEACATVLSLAAPGAVLTCRLMVADGRVEITVFAPVRAGREPVVDRLGLGVLRTLADSVDYWLTTGDDERLFHVRLVRSSR